MAWTEQQLDMLRRLYPDPAWPPGRIGQLLGKSYACVRSKARKLNLRRPGKQPWTDAEDVLVRELYPTHTSHQIAARLGRTHKSVVPRIKHLGLTKHPHWPVEVLERVRALHAESLPDRMVAKLMSDVFRGRDAHSQAKHVRQRLGLPTNLDREGKQAGIQRQYATLGIETAGQLRALAYRRYAAENGWPEDLRPRAVQILNLLAARGVPMTRREIADGIGMPWKGSRKSLTSNDPEGSYLAHLVARGLVAVLKRSGTVPGRGKGRSVDLYYLGPQALTILEERSRCAKVTTV